MDFLKEKNADGAEKMLSEIRSKKNTIEFTSWIEEFLKRVNAPKEQTNSSADTAPTENS